MPASLSGAQPMDIRPCASIPNPSERTDCMRRSAYPPPDASTSTAPRVAPSFDCRLARTSMERAICGDDELADWDARMGQTYQQAIRTQRDPRALQDSQRNWIVQRDRACGSSPEITFSCLLDMTKQRTTALTQFVATATSSPTPTPAPTPTTVPQALNTSPASSEATARQAPPSATTTPTTSTSSDDGFPKVFLFVLFLGEYGEAAAARIIARQIRQGMTDEQLIDSRVGQ